MIAHMKEGNPEKKQSVLDHLNETALIAESLGSPLHMGCLCYVTGLCHDLGKWRQTFEDYITEAVSGKTTKAKGSVNHSSAGAIFIYRRYYKGTPIQKLTAQLICTAILSHHGLNDCMTPDGKNHFQERIEKLDNLDYEEVMRNLKNSSISMEKLNHKFHQAMEEVRLFQNNFSKYQLSQLFSSGLLERMLLSILIDADRLETARFMEDRKDTTELKFDYKIWNELSDNLENYIKGFNPDNKKAEAIASIREMISNVCLKFADRPVGIYRLAVPTGGAKTLSSMRYAVNHARIHKKRRIFYIAPYLSVLEQNAEVYRTALKRKDLILEHHSNVIPENAQEDCKDEYRHLTENWESPLIFTTFVQFLNTLFDGSTGSVRRLHSLCDAVIIIDEIQSLPINMIYIFNLAMDYLHYICNSTIILCSATQPIIDNQERVDKPIHLSNPSDIIEDVDGLYKQLKRVRIEEKKGLLNTEQFRDFILEVMKDNRDILVILNTKGAAAKLYQELCSYYRDLEEPVFLIHLSTNMCAEHRLNQITEIKKKLGKVRIICISTSLIEAGVDLSFSCVIRSYAGLDSIAQAAGRCNRNGEKEEGIVYLIRYEEERLGSLKQILIGGQCSQAVVADYQNNSEKYNDDLLSRPALNAFYERYYYDDKQKRLMDYPVEKQGYTLLDLLSGNSVGKWAHYRAGNKGDPGLSLYQAFKTAGKKFAVIEQNTIGVLVPYKDGNEIIEALNGQLQPFEVVSWARKGQRYAVNVYQNKLQDWIKAGAIVELNHGGILAFKDGFYDENLGVVKEGKHKFLNI